MPFDATTFVGHVAAPRAVAHFRRDEALALTIGALSIGAFSGAGLFFGLGRAPPLMVLAAAMAAYVYAVHLASVRFSELIRARTLAASTLFALHIAALVAWPLMALAWPPEAWQTRVALPAMLASFILLLLVKPEPPSVIYRHSAYVALITAIAVYALCRTAMNIEA
jgi:hypothetical protein